MSVQPLVRPAGEEDCAIILEMVRELAEYERLSVYRQQGAEMLHDWTICRMSGETLWRLADKSL